MTKEAEISAIARLVGIVDPGVGIGSSVPKELFVGACRRLGLDDTGTMPQLAQRIVTAANLPYDSLLGDSRGTPSMGGSTVTLQGLQQVRRAVSKLLS